MFSADLSHFVCSVRIPTWCAFESYGISLQLNPGFSHLYKRVQIFFFLFLMFNFSLSLIFDVLRLHVFSLILLCKFNKPHFLKEGGGVETPLPLSSRSAHEDYCLKYFLIWIKIISPVITMNMSITYLFYIYSQIIWL